MNTENSEKETARSVKEALKICRSSFVSVGVFSAGVNVLMLTPSIYMLATYDRVIASGSIPTLSMLTLIMVFLLAAMGLLEWTRSQILVRVSNKFDALLSTRLYDISLKQALYSGGSNISAAPLQDLNGVRQFLTGNGLFCFFDAPWLPLYIAVMFLFHPVFGWVAIGAALFLVIVALINEKLTSQPLKNANQLSGYLTEANTKRLRNAELIHSMGMLSSIRQRWRTAQEKMLVEQTTASTRSGSMAAFSKSCRTIIQSAILGVGAYLAVMGEVSPGVMIAGSILLGRALAPLDQMIATWKQTVTARGQWTRVNEILQKVPPVADRMELPTPVGALSAKNLIVAAPGSQTPILKNLNFQLNAGTSLGIVGPSGSGKSTLIRTILGIWPAASGDMRLDGADVFTWQREHLGPFIGYLPQDIELFEGTIAENISRFADMESDAVVAAAQAASVQDMILNLPDGYDTSLSQHKLSGGQRQRIALARALYKNPVLVVLDEPNSNLDEQGERALFNSIRDLKTLGSTIIVVTHRTNILAELDNLMVLGDGQIVDIGARDEVVARIASKTGQQNSQPVRRPRKTVPVTPIQRGI